MIITLESLARTIAKARHGTDAMWANYMPSARAVVEALEVAASEDMEWDAKHWLRTLLAQADGGQ